MRPYYSITVPKVHFPSYGKNAGMVAGLNILTPARTATDLPRLYLEHRETPEMLIGAAMRRAIDVVFALCTLPVLLFAACIIGLAIRIDSPGPAFIGQSRMGRNKKLFKCIKFRTMYLNGDELLEAHLARNKDAAGEWRTYKKLRGHDPRVTRVGKFLRKTSLDELPQFLNILRGEMTLFGPRPYMPCEEKDMDGYIDVILMALPGITGLWQVSGRNRLTFQDRLQLDAFYVRNWSLWLDIVIFFKTIKVVLHREGAY